jgi:hypothetical protein
MSKAPSSFGEKLQSLPKPALYLVLIFLTSVPLFVTVIIPNKEAKASANFYTLVSGTQDPHFPPAPTIDVNKPVLIQTDWTTSTRGESAGQFKSLMRILMSRGIKFCIFSAGDPQAPQVARDYIDIVNTERKSHGDKPYERWTDYVVAGYFPGAEGISNAIQNNFRTAFQDKRDKDPNGVATPIFESPVLSKVNRVSDFSAMILVTGSNTSNIAIERLKSVPLSMMVTGVMGPETQVYYDSGQLKGLVTGLKGLYDMESLMKKDPQFVKEKSLDQGAAYYPTLHIALVLMILAVIAGNVGMFMSRRRAA